jgi:hypothetical protein
MSGEQNVPTFGNISLKHFLYENILCMGTYISLLVFLTEKVCGVVFQ